MINPQELIKELMDEGYNRDEAITAAKNIMTDRKLNQQISDTLHGKDKKRKNVYLY